jgi:hypothetical protein
MLGLGIRELHRNEKFIHTHSNNGSNIFTRVPSNPHSSVFAHQKFIATGPFPIYVKFP